MQIKVDEIESDIFRISVRPPGSFLSFNQFLIRDERPALIHTGHLKTFAIVREEVSKLIKPSTVKFICFSHYEPDECGSLNEWLELAPQAVACVNKTCDYSVSDQAIRASNILKDGDHLELGRHKLAFIETPHFPHAWEASLFFDETTKTLFSSDIGTQQGFPQMSESSPDLDEIISLQQRLGYMPFGPSMSNGIRKLRQIDFQTMAAMHGQHLSKESARNLFSLLEKENERQISEPVAVPVR